MVTPLHSAAPVVPLVVVPPEEIICLIAPNRHASGIPAWFSGDQSPAGRYNGWSLTEQRWAELAESTACATGRRPPPLVPVAWICSVYLQGIGYDIYIYIHTQYM